MLYESWGASPPRILPKTIVSVRLYESGEAPPFQKTIPKNNFIGLLSMSLGAPRPPKIIHTWLASTSLEGLGPQKPTQNDSYWRTSPEERSDRAGTVYDGHSPASSSTMRLRSVAFGDAGQFLADGVN